MKPHPEGGYFREVYRSEAVVAGASLPECFGGNARSLSTAIYFLLETGNFSAFHRIKSDELWHHYEGVSLEVVVIHPNGELEVLLVGKNLPMGERPLQVVPAGCWFASRVVADGYALVGCTVSPGFDFADFELANREALTARYPQHAALIAELTR